MRVSNVNLQECGGIRIISRSVSWNSEGEWLAIAANDRTVKVHSVDRTANREVVSIAGYLQPVSRVRFHPNEPHHLGASDSKCLRLWDIRQAVQKAVAKIDFPHPIADLRWSTSGQQLVVGHGNSSVDVYDRRRLSAVPPLPVRSYRFRNTLLDTCAFSPSDRYLVAATTNSGFGELRVWNVNDGSAGDAKEPGGRTFPAHTGSVYSLAFSPDGRSFATGGSDSIVGLWDAKLIACRHTVSHTSRFIRSVCFSHDSKFVASCSDDGGVDVAWTSNGAPAGTVGLTGASRPAGGADEICFSPKDYVLACARCPVARPASPAVTVAQIEFSEQ